MESFLKAEIREKTYGTIIVLSGKLCRTTYQKLDFLFKELVIEKNMNFALDLSGIDYLDSKGLNVLTKLSASLNRKGIPLYAFGMNNDVYDILDFVDSAVVIKLLKSERAFRNKVMQACS